MAGLTPGAQHPSVTISKRHVLMLPQNTTLILYWSLVLYGRAMRVERLTGVLGATVYVDDVKVLTDSQLEALREVACEHEVIIIPNQALTPLEQVEFSHRLGPAAQSPFIEPSPDHPEVIKVLKEAKDGNAFNFGGAWHSANGL